MRKKIIFIHGRDIKPPEAALRQLWYEAVTYGLERDFGLAAADRFRETAKSFVYFGDLSNRLLYELAGKSLEDDLSGRQQSLTDLKNLQLSDFNRTRYLAQSQANPLKEALADAFSGLTSAFRLGLPLIAAVAPDMAHYWNKSAYFGSDTRQRLTRVLKQAFDADEKIMLVSHSLGSLISYDNLWKFSHYGEYRRDYGAAKKVDCWVTLGSPLGDENIKQKLKGSEYEGVLKYPHNIREWVNIAAEDDYISHDSRLRNDYREMFATGLLEKPVKDIYPVYNLTVRNGRSNPHSAIGYLVNPAFSKLVWQWLEH